MLFRPLRVFVPLVMVSFTYGLAKMVLDLRHDPMISASSMMGFMSALVILLIGMLGDAIATRMGRLNQNLVAGIQMRELLRGQASVDFEVTYTEEQERFRREVRSWFNANVPKELATKPRSSPRVTSPSRHARSRAVPRSRPTTSSIATRPSARRPTRIASRPRE